MKNISGLIIGLLVIASSVSFYSGMKYQEIKNPLGNMMFRQSGTMMRGNQGFRPITGEIINADEKSITVKTEDKSTKIIVLSTKTSINKSANGTNSDLKKGERVVIFGSQNSDGSVTAQNIQLNPQIKTVEQEEIIKK